MLLFLAAFMIYSLISTYRSLCGSNYLALFAAYVSLSCSFCNYDKTFSTSLKQTNFSLSVELIFSLSPDVIDLIPRISNSFDPLIPSVTLTISLQRKDTSLVSCIPSDLMSLTLSRTTKAISLGLVLYSLFFSSFFNAELAAL